jgi:protein tyrosine/serine phosphatase
MPRSLCYLFGVLILALLIAGPAGYAAYRPKHVRNLRVVRDGVLYRSGQLSLTGLRQVLHDHGIKTVVTLRDAATPGAAPPDRAEEEYCLAQEINYHRISPRTWWAPDGSVPAEEGVRRFREVMDDPRNYPVLIHCFAGLHRTGAYCAIYRMEYDRWINTKAIAEMRALGYRDIEDEWDLLGYLESYRPRWQQSD